MNNNNKTIHLAGGCFWGMQGYFNRIRGVMGTKVGYANGKGDSTNYERVKETDHAETVEITYDKSLVSLEEILLRYFKVIDPKSVNKQGGDRGRPVSYTHLTLPTTARRCRSRWSPDH